MNIPCNVILDLIPLVKDGVASNDSVIIVSEHINSCESCKIELGACGNPEIPQIPIDDKKIIFDIKRRIFMAQLIILIVGGIVGVALTNSMGMFYNFIIMPIIGGLSFIALKRKWYLTPIAIFMLTYLWQTIIGLVLGGFRWTALYSGLSYSVIYTGLVGLGIVISMLLKFAFKKER